MIDYEPDSCICVSPALIAERFSSFEKLMGVRFPQSFKVHSAQYHGGVPKSKCIRTETGRVCVVGRFSNVLQPDLLPGDSMPSWRDTEQDVRLDYSLWYLNELWPENAWLPFAFVDTDGKDCRECHDYFFTLAFTPNGEIVYTNGIAMPEYIADSFETFAEGLSSSGNPIANRRIARF